MARRLWWRLGLAVALGSGAVGCDSASTTDGSVFEERTAVGAVAGTDIVLGAVIDGDSIAIYQCGGADTVDTHTAWFRGTVGTDDDPDAFSLAAEGMTLTGYRDAQGIEGQLEDAAGNRYDFAADATADDGDAGVYIAEAFGYSVGVVVRGASGETLTAQGAACRQGQPCDQVIILSPLTVTQGTIDAQFDDEGTVRDLEVARTLTGTPM